MALLQPIDVAALEEARCAAAISEIARESEPWCGGTMNYDRPDSWANFALGMPFDHEFTEDDFDALLGFYAQRNEPARIGITPFHHESLIGQLREHRFVVKEFESVFACDLRCDCAHAEPYEPPAGMRIQVVDVADDEAVKQFAQIATSGFIEEGDDPDTHVPIAIKAASHPRAVNLVASVDGTPAGAGSVEIAGDIAALYGVTTLEPFRGRRIQRALIDHRLGIARDAGCRVAAIASKPGIATERNAMRAGFSPSYTHVQMERPVSAAGSSDA